VDFRNAMIIMTSNVGAETIKKGTALGFDVPEFDSAHSREEEYEDMRRSVMDKLRRAFRPEFLNRVDATIVFRALTPDEIGEIVDLELRKVNDRLAERAMSLRSTPAAKKFLAEKGFDPDYGARPLRRLITNMVEDQLSDVILSGKVRLGSTVEIDYDPEADKLTFNEVELTPPLSEPA
jgi:ATP-dependent Clp protease ATP-binding subunit ClpC